MDSLPKVRLWVVLVILGFSLFLLISLAVKSWPAEPTKVCEEYPELALEIEDCSKKEKPTESGVRKSDEERWREWSPVLCSKSGGEWDGTDCFFIEE